MKDYVIYIDKITTSVMRVPAKNKKEAVQIAERFIDDIYCEKININTIIKFNPDFRIKVRPSTHKSVFFMRRNKKW